jgi:hypothetical protein
MEIAGDLAAYTEADYEQDKAAAEAAAKLALTRPAGQAVGCIAAAAWNNETFPLTGFNHRIWPADESNDDFADARVRWRAEGHDYELTLRYHVIHGWGQIFLEVDGEDVADLRGHAAVGDEPMRMVVTGAMEYEIGPWEEHVIAVAGQLRAVDGK